MNTLRKYLRDLLRGYSDADMEKLVEKLGRRYLTCIAAGSLILLTAREMQALKSLPLSVLSKLSTEFSNAANSSSEELERNTNL